MAKFVLGDVVTDGARTGTVADGFYWNDADDGTKNKPDASGNFLPITWEDGTQGYRNISTLEYA